MRAASVVFFWSAAAWSFPIAYEGFSYSNGAIIDTQSGGFGWTSSVRATGSGGTDAACDNIICACPEDPADAKVTRGSSGPSWTASSTYTAHNTVRATGMSYPGLPVSGASLKLVYAGAPAGGYRSFRTLDLSTPALASTVLTFNNGLGGAPRHTLGKAGTTIWLSVLMSMDCNGAACRSSKTSANGGIHLFDGIGAIDAAGTADGPKHPFEHLQIGDRNVSDTWIVARTMGQCMGGASTFEAPGG